MHIYIYKCIIHNLYKHNPNPPTASRWSPSACKRALLRRVPRRGCKLWAFNFLSTLASCPVDSHAVFSPTSRGSCRATSSSKSRKGFLGWRRWKNQFFLKTFPILSIFHCKTQLSIIWVWLFFLRFFPFEICWTKGKHDASISLLKPKDSNTFEQIYHTWETKRIQNYHTATHLLIPLVAQRSRVTFVKAMLIQRNHLSLEPPRNPPNPSLIPNTQDDLQQNSIHPLESNTSYKSPAVIWSIPTLQSIPGSALKLLGNQ